jgi:hypothetical protein
MPISDKQLAANRRNAQFSTGPRTPEGKERSSLNGFKHPELGLTALMVDEDREAQFEFVREYLADLAPQGFHELQLARTIAMDSWRLNRIKAVEENIFAWGFAVEHKDCCSSEIPQVENAMIHAVSYMHYADRIDKLSLYESRLSRTIARNIELLRKSQAQHRNQVTHSEAAPAAEMQTQTAGAASQTNRTLTAENGFARQDSPQLEKQSVTPFANRDHTENRPGLVPAKADSEPFAPGRAA